MPDRFVREVQQGRALVNAYALPDACTISRFTTQGSGPDAEDIWVVIASDVPCRYTESPSVQDTTTAGHEGTAIDAVCTLPALTDVLEGDMVRPVVGGVDFEDFIVTSVQRKSWETQRPVWLRRTQ